MELIIFLIDHYYLSLPLIVTIILLIYATSKKGGTKISPQNLVALSNNENGFIVDLRDSEEFQNGHITGSINIPFINLSKRTNEIPQDKSVILVCEMGNVSPNAGELLKKEGFEELLILKGGINEWRIQNLPLV